MTKKDDKKDLNIEEELVRLQKELEETKTHCFQMETNWKRALADYQNLQKRAEEEREQIVRFANVTLLESLLPVLDNLEMLNLHSEDQGLELTLKDFKRVLHSLGLEEFNSQDSYFDENFMEAVELVDGEKNKVIEVLKKGYLFKGKVIRPAYVKVGKGA